MGGHVAWREEESATSWALEAEGWQKLYAKIGVGGGCARGDIRGSKRRTAAKWSMPPRWLTVNGISAMWWVLRACITASVVEAVVVRPCNFARMLAKWVQVIVGIDGWDFFARLLQTWGIVMSIPIVVVTAEEGVSRSTETSRGRRLGKLGIH
jgi:hypothetical protein